MMNYCYSYFKKQPMMMEEEKVVKASKAKELMNKFYYRLMYKMGNVGAKNMKLVAFDDEISVLGAVYTCGGVANGEMMQLKNQELQAHVSRLCVFTYRSWTGSIPGTNITTDAGWGCMIRAGQMMFANVLLSMSLENEEMAESDEKVAEEKVRSILKLFNDNSSGAESPFSIKNIVPLAYKHFNIKPGEYFRSTSIMLALDKLNDAYAPEASTQVEVVNFNDAALLLDKLYERVYGDKPTFMSGDEIETALVSKKWPKKVLLVLTAILGADTPQENFKECVEYLLTLPWSRGLLGGIGGGARYFFGTNARTGNLYCLDPHSLQSSTGAASSLDSYFKKQVYELPYEHISTSASFAFLISNEREWARFFERVRSFESENRDNSFYCIMKKEPVVNMDDIITISL